jgi:hypothetical protein
VHIVLSPLDEVNLRGTGGKRHVQNKALCQEGVEDAVKTSGVRRVK